MTAFVSVALVAGAGAIAGGLIVAAGAMWLERRLLRMNRRLRRVVSRLTGRLMVVDQAAAQSLLADLYPTNARHAREETTR